MFKLNPSFLLQNTTKLIHNLTGQFISTINSSQKSYRFHGIYTPIATPFNEKQLLDFTKLSSNLKKLSQTDLAGLVIMGTNGEFCYLEKSEKIELVKFVSDFFASNKIDKKLIIGTGCESTSQTIDLTQKVYEASNKRIHGILVLPPHYYKSNMTDSVLQKYYEEVANNSPVPLMIYNMPLNTGINLSPKLIQKLAMHQNIAGIKDTSGSILQLAEIINLTKDRQFSVFAGNAGYLLPALSIGCLGATVATGNVLPNEICQIQELFIQKKYEQARDVQMNILEINQIITARFGVPALKYAMNKLGFEGGEVRKPLEPPSKEQTQIIDEAIQKFKQWKNNYKN